MASGITIVAQIADTVRRQGVLKDGEDLLAYRVGHPRIDAVRADVVEGPELGGDIHDVVGAQHDVLESHPGDELIAFGDGLLAQVQSDEFALRPLKSDGDEIFAVAASKL